MSVSPDEFARKMAEQQAAFDKQLADAKAAQDKALAELGAAGDLALKEQRAKAEKAEADLAEFQRSADTKSKSMSQRLADLETGQAKILKERDDALARGKHSDAAVQLLPIYGSAHLEPAMLMAERHGLIDYAGETPKIDLEKLKTVYEPPKPGGTLAGVNPAITQTTADLDKALKTRDFAAINAAMDAQLKLTEAERRGRTTRLPQ